jgi:hypothetical protein
MESSWGARFPVGQVSIARMCRFSLLAFSSATLAGFWDRTVRKRETRSRADNEQPLVHGNHPVGCPTKFVATVPDAAILALTSYRKIYFDDFSMRSLSLASAQKSALFMAVGGNPPRTELGSRPLRQRLWQIAIHGGTFDRRVPSWHWRQWSRCSSRKLSAENRTGRDTPQLLCQADL